MSDDVVGEQARRARPWWFSALLLAALALAACAEGVSSAGVDDDDGSASSATTGAGGGGGAGVGGAGVGGAQAGSTSSSSSGAGGASGARTPLVGELVITEIMPNPNAVADDLGEWFEFTNVSSDTLSLDGCTLTDGDVPPDDEVSFSAGIVLTSGQRVVVARSASSAQNGGLPPVAFALGTDFILANTSDEILILCGGTVIDEVTYASGSPLPFTTGGAAQLDSGSVNAAANDIPANWCTATEMYGSGDMGTPGQPNGACP